MSGADGEVERGASIDSSFTPDFPAVAGDDALHGGQSDAGAGELAHRVQPLKGLEQTIGVFGVETGAVIANEECQLSDAPLATKLDARLLAVRAVFPGIA